MAKGSLRKGIFITFEGPEGCGKSTQSRLLVEYLRGKGYRCVHTREPGGTPLGEGIRKILLDSLELQISGLSELLLFEAARAAIVRDLIRPALKKRAIVVSDRFSDATFVYQGYAGGLELKLIDTIDRIATGALKPDITIVLDIETSLGLARATKTKRDRMERKPFRYHAKVRRGYLKLAKTHPGRIKVIRIEDSIDKVQAAVRKKVEGVIQKYSGAG